MESAERDVQPKEPSLQQKLLRLTMNATEAERLASFWQKAIDEHGEDKAEEFYTQLAEMNICEPCGESHEVLKADLEVLKADLAAKQREIAAKERDILVGDTLILLLKDLEARRLDQHKN